MTRQFADDNAYDQFIDGAWRDSHGSDRIEVEFPYDGEIWASVPEGTAEDVDAAVTAASEAVTEWRGITPSRRSALLHEIADAIDDHAAELGELETRQNGKLIREMQGQMEGLGGWFRYFAGMCGTDRGDVRSVENKDDGMFNYTLKEPYGVVGAITPWNSPLLLTTFKLAPALAAGNTFVHKPSKHTPVSALRLAEIITEETDVPDGVYNVVTGRGSVVGDALTDHDGVDKLAFTGSTAVGREIGRKAGDQLIPVSLELGGKSPNILFPDANLDNAINGVVKGIFAATGQTCLAGSRVFVHEEIYDEFLDRFTDRVSDIELGDPMDPETEMGPIAFREQYETVKDYVETGTSEGATLAFGGEQPSDLPGECFIQPTILADVDNDMQVAQEEIFGPVASVIRFSGEDEVVRKANDSDYGLAAGIWTEDMRRAQRLAQRLAAGNIWINEYRILTYSTPFGGYKDSGLGRENGKEAFDEYRQVKSVWMDLTGEVSDPFTLG